jgi:UDP-3-O-[3-hydroxymyristoyl] glucosamine N-acyltransferase
MTELTVGTIAALVGGRVVGDPARAIVGLGDLHTAGPRQIGFVRDKKYREAARGTQAGAVLTFEPLDTAAAQIIVTDVSVAYTKIAQQFFPAPVAVEHAIHPTAVVHPEAELLPPVQIGPRCVVGRSRLHPGCLLKAGSVVGDDCVLGEATVLYPNVTIYDRVQLGQRVIVHGGTVIGSDGFGYAKEGSRYLKVPQIGGVEIGDDVEIGANCTIDRGALQNTSIGAGSKIDNLCHIAHNCRIGRDVVLAGGCLLAGSTTLGDRVTFGGHVVTAGHLRIADDVRVGGNSAVAGDIEEAGDYMGFPLMEKRRFARHLRALRDLLELRNTVEDLAEDEGDGHDPRPVTGH